MSTSPDVIVLRIEIYLDSAFQSKSHLPPLVAVKSSKLSESESLSKEKELLDKFQDCPSILRCFGDDITTENNEKLYNILLEYASGGCLVDRIHRKGLTENIVSRYTKSILKALIHIHKLGYLHCDVKPHNVLIVGDHDHEDAKLADFGSCKCWRDDIGKSCDFRGTVIYAAPESISRQEYVPESDVWALGCTVLQMLTGKSPWVIDRKTMEAKDVLFKIGCSNDIPEIQRHKISKEAKDFLKKCLVKDPRARVSKYAQLSRLEVGDVFDYRVTQNVFEDILEILGWSPEIFVLEDLLHHPPIYLNYKYININKLSIFSKRINEASQLCQKFSHEWCFGSCVLPKYDKRPTVVLGKKYGSG
ncbi:hypothetical protein DH2020_002799 [Rehmannia glutinosa]|uniref:Protein kinase domain-containing protein n=1 Tax=Rehmannia glutinosa TaxID=99300 RepID=A0ABR0XV67_REHGL